MAEHHARRVGGSTGKIVKREISTPDVVARAMARQAPQAQGPPDSEAETSASLRCPSAAAPAIEHVLAIFRGRGIAGDTTGQSPENTSLKQQALDLVSAA